MWMGMAVLSAVFAAMTAIFTKIGIRKTDSDVATALRTIVVLVFAWGMVFLKGSQSTLSAIPGRSVLFLILSGLCTGLSWIFYFKALSMGDVNKVTPIDKSSTVLTMLLAMVLFGETAHLPAKLVGTALLSVGIFLMIEKKDVRKTDAKNGYLFWAVLSAVFASLTSILAKIGIRDVESNLATAIRTGVVLVLAWGIVFGKGKAGQLRTIDRKELLCIGISGLCTGGSWLCYYYAIAKGVVSVVVPIDKMSILLTVLFAVLVFREKLRPKAWAGLALMVSGTLLIAIMA